MHLSNPRKSAAGTCPFCHDKAGTLSREHPECRRVHQAGWMRRSRLQPAGDAKFKESETLVVRNLWNDGLIGTGLFLGHSTRHSKDVGLLGQM